MTAERPTALGIGMGTTLGLAYALAGLDFHGESAMTRTPAERLKQLIDHASAHEVRVLLLLTERLTAGRSQYGPSGWTQTGATSLTRRSRKLSIS
jgi:hypothetical protein